MPPFLVAFWKPIALAIVFGCLVIAVKVQTERLRAVKAEYAGFKAQVEAIGRNQIENNKRKYQADMALKGRLDDENKTLRNNLAATGKRLRDLSAGSGGVPEIPATPGSPDTITLGRTGLNQAIREHVTQVRGILEEITGIVVEGVEATVDLNTGKAWVREQSGK